MINIVVIADMVFLNKSVPAVSADLLIINNASHSAFNLVKLLTRLYFICINLGFWETAHLLLLNSTLTLNSHLGQNVG